MNFIASAERHPPHFLPAALDDYITPDNAARFLDACVNKLDRRAVGFLFPKHDPTGRNPGEFWRVHPLRPDLKTRANCRPDNAPEFQAVRCEFTDLCRPLDWFGGPQSKARNAAGRNWRQRQPARPQAQIEARRDAYLKAGLERRAAAKAAPPDKLAARKARIAPGWGTLKRRWPGGFLVWRKARVGTGVRRAHLEYHLQQARAVVRPALLLAAFAGWKSRPVDGADFIGSGSFPPQPHDHTLVFSHRF